MDAEFHVAVFFADGPRQLDLVPVLLLRIAVMHSAKASHHTLRGNVAARRGDRGGRGMASGVRGASGDCWATIGEVPSLGSVS